MVEVQSHGFSFEKWVRDNLFEGYRGDYMQKWDIPPDFNRHEDIPASMRGVPISVKTAKYGSPIGLGDINRQRAILEPFLLIVGFWRQRTPTQKWIEDIGWVLFSPSQWDSLWGNLDADQIRIIDKRIKDFSLAHPLARREAQEWKVKAVASSGSKIVVNPKIDSKKQRRIQCSLPFQVFWDAVGREPTSSDSPELFGLQFTNPILSSPRTFNSD